MVQVIKCMYNCDTTRKLYTRLREQPTTPNWRLCWCHSTNNAWLKQPNFSGIERMWTSKKQRTNWNFGATSIGSFHGVRIPPTTYRWSCSKTDKSNCCSRETRFSEATCGFRRRDVGNCALKFRSRKNTSLRLQPVSFLLAFVLLFMHQDHLDKFSILFIRHDHLNQFRPCVTLFWTNFQFCSFITIPLTTFSMHCDVLNEFLMTNEIDVLTKHHTTALITTCNHQRQGPNCTFSCGATVVFGPRYLVCASLGLSSPDILETRFFPD